MSWRTYLRRFSPDRNRSSIRSCPNSNRSDRGRRSRRNSALRGILRCPRVAFRPRFLLGCSRTRPALRSRPKRWPDLWPAVRPASAAGIRLPKPNPKSNLCKTPVPLDRYQSDEGFCSTNWRLSLIPFYSAGEICEREHVSMWKIGTWIVRYDLGSRWANLPGLRCFGWLLAMVWRRLWRVQGVSREVDQTSNLGTTECD